MTPSGGEFSGGGQPPDRGVPETIDRRYRVSRLLGRGGQGQVYLAHDENLDIEVAIKLLHSDFRTPEFMERFTLDARILARLDSPNIVHIFDFNPRWPYLVMEFCGDGDLNRLIKTRRPLTLPRTISLIRQICNALRTAHERDDPILHRDLKPGNVLFKNDVPKVTDFGLAKVLGDATSGRTRTHSMMGTVGYASPEQLVDASKVDHRTDLWAVGVILYELLTFHKPFEAPGEHPLAVGRKVCEEPPASPSYEIPEPLWNVVLRCLEKEPVKRFASAGEMAQSLEQALALVPGGDRLRLPPEEALDDVDRLAQRAADSLESGSVEDAQPFIEEMRRIAPESDLARYWNERLVEESRESQPSAPSFPSVEDLPPASRPTVGVAPTPAENRYDPVELLMQERDWVGARRECGRLLAVDSGDSKILQLLQQISERETEEHKLLEKAQRDAASARTAGDLVRLLAIWQDVNERLPGHADVQAELAVARSELDARRRAEQRGRAEREAEPLHRDGRLQEALDVWEGFLAEFPGDEEAASRRDALRDELAARTQRERRAAQLREAGELEQEGRLEAALGVLDQWLAEHPGDEEFVRRAEPLRVEIADRKLAGLLDATRRKAEACRAANDPEGALRHWSELLRDHPTHEEVLSQVDRLKHEIEARDKSLAADRLRERVADAEGRLEARRYASVESSAKAVAEATGVARRNLDGGLPALRTAEDGLQSALSAAEHELRQRMVAGRGELRARVGQVAEMLEAEGPTAVAASSGDRALRAAWRQAATALATADAPDAPGDPVARVTGADETLQQCLSAFQAERREATDAARAAAEQAVRAAGGAVDALRAAPELAAVSIDLAELEGRHTALAEQLGIESAARLQQVARDAAVLEAEAESSRLWSLRSLVQQLRGLMQTAMELAPATRSDRLPDLIRAAHEVTGAGIAELSLERLATARDGLREEVESCRQALAAAASTAEARWNAASAGSPSAEVAREFERIKASGAEALADSRFDEVERCARQLESLARRGEIEATWDRHRGAVRGIEGPADDDGVIVDVADEDVLQVITSFREAIAAGDMDAARAAGGRLPDRRGGDAEPEELAEIPSVSGRARKLNRRHRPELLERFDEAVEKYEAAREEGGRDAGRWGETVERSHAMLLRPPPLWPRVVVPVVVVAVVAWAFVVWTPTGSAAWPVRVFSPTGEVEVNVVRVDDDAWELPEDSPRRISEQGVRWMLPPGDYAVRTGDGDTIEFRVPDDRSVVIPGPTEVDFAGELIRELGLRDWVESSGPDAP
jgi:serine/threonine protein kinase